MKRIVICADGTWNEPERKDEKSGRPQPTNVLKVARAVLPRSSTGHDQIVYYHEGVGTLGNLDKWTGGAFGHGMEKNVRSLYRFLVYNYEPNDELYLFGFSRGAFTVRTLVGFMNKVGLLQKNDEFYTPEVYALYESSAALDSAEWKHAFRRIRDARPCPIIHFIGVWDTVGALGPPGLLGHILNPNKYRYHDIELHPNILNACHAVAIDERRKPFAPSLWSRPPGWTGTLKQVWFAGVHSNVGGGYHPDGLANEALHWMIEEAERLGLEFDKQYLAHYRPCFNSVLQDSMSTMYRIMGAYERVIGNSDAEAVHQSAFDRVSLRECSYDPANLRSYAGGAGKDGAINTTRIQRGTPCEE